MFLTPRGADFWRPWFVAAALSAAAIGVFWGMGRAHADWLRASFYGAESGTRTASGGRFRPMGHSAASWTFPFGTKLSVCLVGCDVVTVDDRGPAPALHRDLDLSRGAARAIGLERLGVARVRVQVLGAQAPHAEALGRPPSRRRPHTRTRTLYHGQSPVVVVIMKEA